MHIKLGFPKGGGGEKEKGRPQQHQRRKGADFPKVEMASPINSTNIKFKWSLAFQQSWDCTEVKNPSQSNKQRKHFILGPHLYFVISFRLCNLLGGHGWHWALSSFRLASVGEHATSFCHTSWAHHVSWSTHSWAKCWAFNAIKVHGSLISFKGIFLIRYEILWALNYKITFAGHTHVWHHTTHTIHTSWAYKFFRSTNHWASHMTTSSIFKRKLDLPKIFEFNAFY